MAAVEQTAKKLKLSFLGAVEEVTGSNFLLESLTGAPGKYLIDCGLYQGGRICNPDNANPFPFNPAEIDILFVTHAHLDHVGRIPHLVKAGFKGKIYSTPPTREIGELQLVDSLGVLTKEAKHHNCEILYSEADVAKAMALWQTAEYHEPIEAGDMTVVLRDAGHIMGSAMVEFMSSNGKKIVFTGDLGNSPDTLLPDTEDITDATYLVMESVYGDRNHEDRQDRTAILEDVIESTMHNNGTLMIPAFSIERTQQILYEIEGMMENSRIPLVPVFIDSPLAIKVTGIYKKYASYFKETVREHIASGNTIFKFPQLQMTLTSDESKAIVGQGKRKIIMAGSGMSNGGRILHHEKHYLPDPDSTLLLVGYQAAGSMGRLLQEGVKEVKIFGEIVPVRARVVTISGYSGHKGTDELQEFARKTADTVKQVFVVIGEPKSSMFLTQRLRDYFGINASAPKVGDSVEIEL